LWYLLLIKNKLIDITSKEVVIEVVVWLI